MADAATGSLKEPGGGAGLRPKTLLFISFRVFTQHLITSILNKKETTRNQLSLIRVK